MSSGYDSSSAKVLADPFENAPISAAAAAAVAAVASGPDQYVLLSSAPVLDAAAAVRGAVGGGGAEDTMSQVMYNCGDCNTEQRLDRASMMRCRECGGRMFYKQRTKRMVQFEAR